MQLESYECQRCGGSLSEIEGGKFKCDYCRTVYYKKAAEDNTKKVAELFDEVKREQIRNLRRNLFDATNEEYISSEKVRECAAELKKLIPDDFSACFYEVAVGNNAKALTKYIRKINVEDNYAEIEGVVCFLIKSLQTEFLLELNNLVERAYKQRDLALFEKYSTEISIEAEKVESGIYETKMPREVFIAYSSKDMDAVSELCEFLEAQGLKCFVAARNLRHGKGSVENYNKALEEAMDHCRSFVFVSSMNSRSFGCDALAIELPYIEKKDLENSPAEFRNDYKSIPQIYKKPRVEYRIEESHGFNAADSMSNEFFDGYERVYSPEAVAERVTLQLLSATKKVEKKPAPAPVPVSTPAPAPVVVQTASVDAAGQKVEPLLKRAMIFIDDGEWNDAASYCEKALDIDPECAQAYILNLMIDLKIGSQDDLVKCKEPFDGNGNYKKAIRFGDEATVALLEGYIDSINERNETERKNKIYDLACKLMKSDTMDGYEEAISKFGEIPSWRDSQKKIEECRDSIKLLKEKAEIARKEDIYKRACDLMEKNDIKSVNEALKLFSEIPSWRDSQKKIEECHDSIKLLKEKAEIARKENVYKRACDLMEKNDINSVNEALMLFSGIQKFKDVPNQITICQSMIAEINKRIEEERKRKIERMVAADKERARKKKFLTILIIGIIAFILVCIFVIYPLVSYGSGNYAVYINMYGITDFTVPDGVTSIGDKAFYDCSSLTSVVIPDSVTSIGDSAFVACRALTSIEIPDSVTSIGDKAFYDCSSLTSVYITDMEAWCNISFVSLYANPLPYAKNLYLNGELVTELVIPEGVTSIGKYAFSGCDSLTSVTIPDSVTSIGDEAFRGCSSLTSVVIGDSVTSIGYYAFQYCSSLTSVTIPDSVTSIGYQAFYDCSSLTSVTIPDSVTSIDSHAFYGCSSLTSVVIGDGVTSIGDSAFYNCSRLTSVYITDIAAWCNISFEYNSANPLRYAKNLYLNGELVTELVIPDSVTSIGGSAFYNCSSLTSVTIPDSVTSIGGSAFYNCSSLTSVTIPDSVTSIGEYAFYNCSSLICNEYDNGYYLGNEINPYFVLVKAKDTSITTCIVNEDTKAIHSSAFYNCSSLTSVVIPDSVTSIGSEAFRNCSSLKSVVIPDSVTSIGSEAFRNCSSLICNEYDNGYYLGNEINPYFVLVKAKDTSITTCIVNEDTKVIHSSAFYKCSSLTSVVIGDSVTSIGNSAFSGCSSLTSIEIPDSVTSIRDYAFDDCSSLTSVVIPDSVTSIGYQAFDLCSSLTTVYYTGSEEDWAKISIGSWNSPLTKATKIYNYVPEGE